MNENQILETKLTFRRENKYETVRRTVLDYERSNWDCDATKETQSTILLGVNYYFGCQTTDKYHIFPPLIKLNMDTVKLDHKIQDLLYGLLRNLDTFDIKKSHDQESLDEKIHYQDRSFEVTIETLIDEAFKLPEPKFEPKLNNLLTILFFHKDLVSLAKEDRETLLKTIVSKITPEQLEQLTDKQIEKWSKSVDTYLGLRGTEVGKFKKDIENKRASNKTNNQQKTLQILLQNQNKTTIDANLQSTFQDNVIPFLTKEQVINCLLEKKSPEEIKELNQLLPQDFRVAEVQNDVQKKKIIEKALDFLKLEGYGQSLEPETTEKPKTSVFCCCAQPTVQRNKELVVGGR